VTTPIGSRMEPATSTRVVYVGGPWEGPEAMLATPGGGPTLSPDHSLVPRHTLQADTGF
jgi:hypothetical protein